MNAKHITPILNVSDMAASFAWFEKWGWTMAWDWGSPPDFGSVQSGECDIFLCLNGQGGGGSWVCVAVDDVDAVHRQCVAAHLEVTFPPTDMPWNFREMHVRHPDGHVFRVGTAIEED
jgi:catechol 2,3-dioxygenase-like lactoylglutathione lyase family enzyme